MIPQDSIIEKERKDGLNGNADWHGWCYVYDQIKKACDLMNKNYTVCTDLHIEACAALGSGHDVRMKSMMWKLKLYGWLSQNTELNFSKFKDEMTGGNYESV